MAPKRVEALVRFYAQMLDEQDEADERADAISDALVKALEASGELLALGVAPQSFSVPDWNEEDDE